MVISCCAINCRNRQDSSVRIQFHRFPLKDKILCQKWILAMRRGNWTAGRWSFLCGKHFTDDDYKSTAKRYLKPNTVPSVFNFEKHKKKDEKGTIPQDQEKTNSEETILQDQEKTNSDNEKTNNVSNQCIIIRLSAAISDLKTCNKEIQTEYPINPLSCKNKGIQTLELPGPNEKKMRRKKRLLKMKLNERNKRKATLELILRYMTNICRIPENELAKLDEKFGEGLLEAPKEKS